MAKRKTTAPRQRGKPQNSTKRNTGAVRTITRVNVPFADLTTAAVAGTSENTLVLGASCHQLNRDLQDAVEFRLRSATLTVEPVVSSTEVGTYAVLFAPGPWSPSYKATILNMGGTEKRITQKMTVSLQGSDDDWINHANGKARIYYTDSTDTKTVLMAKMSYTIQVRGHR